MRQSMFRSSDPVRLWLGIVLVGVTVAAASAAPAWRPLPASPVNSWRHDDVSFVSPTTGWVINTNGYVYGTTDGGASWSTLLHQPESTFRCCGFANELVGWIGTTGADCFGPGGDETLIYRTTDGGVTWIGVPDIVSPPEGLCGMWVVSETVVYVLGRVCGSPGLAKTTDGGLTWASFDLAAHADRLIDCWFPDASTGFAVGGIDDPVSGFSRGVVLHTTDGGASWTNRHTTADERQYCWKISFPSPTVGYVSVQLNETSQSPVVLKTTDGGATWEEKNIVPGYYYEQGIGFVSETHGWVGGGIRTHETTDGGDTWTAIDIDDPGTVDNINRFRFLTPTLGYAVGTRVYKYSDDDVVVAPATLAAIGEPSFLDPPQPNPFREAVEIRFRVPAAGATRVTVYDVLGREVTRLLEGHRAAGPHTTRWEAAGRPAGVYVIRLDAPGHAESRKVLLLR